MRGTYGGVPCGSRWWLALTGGCMAARGGGLGLGGAAAADQLRGADGGYGGPPIDDCVPEEGVGSVWRAHLTTGYAAPAAAFWTLTRGATEQLGDGPTPG